MHVADLLNLNQLLPRAFDIAVACKLTIDT